MHVPNINPLKGYMSKILFVFKRFRSVESFVWIRRVEIIILNFSRYRVLHARACQPRCTLTFFTGFADDVQFDLLYWVYWCALWPSLLGWLVISRITRYKRRIVLMFWICKEDTSEARGRSYIRRKVWLVYIFVQTIV
jgi:hypothetical protein